MNRLFICLTIVLALGTGGQPAGALEVDVRGDTLSLRAEDVFLQDILKWIARREIDIRIDPKLNPKVTASFTRKEMESGLKILLKSLDYALIWESVPGSKKLRLTEIQIFEPGKRSRMRPLDTDDDLSIARNPEDGSFFVRDELLLRFRPGTPLAVIENLIHRIGGTIIAQHEGMNVVRVRLPENTDVPRLSEALARESGVARAEPNYAYPISLPYKGLNPISVDFPKSTPLHPGEGVPIAVLDSGLMPGAGLEDRVLASLDAVNPGGVLTDGLGHGTQMSLVASGLIRPLGADREDASTNPLIPIRAFDDNGMTSNFHLMRSIDFAIQNGARVMSLSWGTENQSRFLEEAMEYAEAKNLLVVASAGNEPTGKPVYPAAYASVLGVGALKPDGTAWEQSNFGDFVSLSAPGFANLPVGYQGEPGAYAGTSIAAAFVANAAAQHIQNHPDVSREGVKRFLENRFPNHGQNRTDGHPDQHRKPAK